MNRSTIVCLLFLVVFSVGYRTGTSEDTVSKIVLHGTTLIRTTPGVGIKLYDLSNPATPVLRGTIGMSSNADIATKGNYMYADNGLDLIVFDISDIAAPKGVDTVRAAFNSTRSAFVPIGVPEERGLSTGASGCNPGCNSDVAVDAPVSAGEAAGKTGSLARFAIVGHYLYCIDDYSMRVFDISDPARPRYKNMVQISWAIETLFPHGDKLFIGGREGMYIYSIDDPEQPDRVGEFEHPRRCDPVVVEGDYAYVTLRGGGACGGTDDQLDIIDIRNLAYPRLVKTVPLDGPYGLAVRDRIVLVCDGAAGVVIIDATDPANPKRIGAITGIAAHDIILDDRLMIISAEDGFHLYDVTDIRNPRKWTKLQF